MNESTGWLLDLYPEPQAMVLWVLTDAGERLRLRDPFTPSFFVRGEASLLRKFLRRLRHSPVAAAVGCTQRIDFWTGKPVEVVECAITEMLRFPKVLSTWAKDFADLEFFNCDLLPVQHYCYGNPLFPTARARFRYRDDLSVEAIKMEDSEWSNDYQLPPLRIMRLEGE
jgi:hypothetical protein